nr:MAG TPA: hypothetical protein [Caudoviricetes sp.]
MAYGIDYCYAYCLVYARQIRHSKVKYKHGKTYTEL